MRKPGIVATRPACMTAGEWHLWSEANDIANRAKSETPCRDCTEAWHASRMWLGECDGYIVKDGEPFVVPQTADHPALPPN